MKGLQLGAEAVEISILARVLAQGTVHLKRTLEVGQGFVNMAEAGAVAAHVLVIDGLGAQCGGAAGAHIDGLGGAAEFMQAKRGVDVPPRLGRLLLAQFGGQHERLAPAMFAHETQERYLDDALAILKAGRQRRDLPAGLWVETQLHIALGGDDPAFGFGHF